MDQNMHEINAGYPWTAPSIFVSCVDHKRVFNKLFSQEIHRNIDDRRRTFNTGVLHILLLQHILSLYPALIYLHSVFHIAHPLMVLTYGSKTKTCSSIELFKRKKTFNMEVMAHWDCISIKDESKEADILQNYVYMNEVTSISALSFL